MQSSMKILKPHIGDMAKVIVLSSMLAILTAPLALTCFRTNQNNKLTYGTKNDKISVRGRWMVDGYGRVRIFHGFNAVRKSFPWYSDMMSDGNLTYYHQWGFNAVRMGAMWSGVEPSEGVTNTTYLNILKDIVERASQRGIYILLDMHQDVISSAFKAYDGVPRWVIDKMPASRHAYPWPLPKLDGWASGYLTEAVGNAFQCLYDNVGGASDAMAHFWQTIASTFKDYNYVIGYELINEPWAGDIYKHPDLLLPANADRVNLARLYEKLNTAIRRVDNDTLIFYEPVTWGMVLPGNGSLGSGFVTVPGGNDYSNRSVMSWHYYCWILTTYDTMPYNKIQRTLCDKLLAPKVFNSVNSDIQRTGGGSFLTEFGLCEPNANSTETQTIECEFVMNMADQNFQSWTYWDARFFIKKTGKVREDVIRHFARVYTSATAGIPKSMMFDMVSRKFQFIFQCDTHISAPTEIIVPPLHYPKGFVVKVSSGLTWTYDKTAHLLLVRPTQNQNAIRFRDETVWIFPKYM